MMLIASLRVYGGKCMYKTPEQCKVRGLEALDTNIRDNAVGNGIRSGKRASEGSKVALPPRCSSMPSRTRTSFSQPPSLAVLSNNFCRLTTKEFNVSIFPYSSICSASPIANMQAEKILDSRCRCDRQSAHLARA